MLSEYFYDIIESAFFYRITYFVLLPQKNAYLLGKKTLLPYYATTTLHRVCTGSNVGYRY